MLRVAIGSGVNITKHVTSTEWIGINSTFSQTIRFIRKPMYLPPAKSKLFRISKRYRPPQEEFIEITRLYNNYKTYRRAIKFHMQKLVALNQIEFDEEVVKKAEEMDYDRSIELNNQWNAEVKILRDQRLAKEKAARQEKIIKKTLEKKVYEQKQLEEIENKVRQAKMDASTFITPNNIDQAIEEALTQVVNYNEAIDIEGNTYKDYYNSKDKKYRHSTVN